MNREEYFQSVGEEKKYALDMSKLLAVGESFENSVKAQLINQGLTFQAVDYGTEGNSITVTLVDPGVLQASTVFTVTNTDITVTLQHDGTDITATATSVVSDFTSAPAEVTALVSLSGSGSSTLSALAQTNLSGGLKKVTITQVDVSLEAMPDVSVVQNPTKLHIEDGNVVTLLISNVEENKTYRIDVLLETDNNQKLNRRIFISVNA